MSFKKHQPVKKISILSLVTIFTSCIPYSFAPRFKKEGYKVVQAKRFQRKLPKQTSFIFKDPKDAGEFYNYINKKFNLKHDNVGLNTPFKHNGKTYYLSYSEVERSDKTANIGLAMADLIIEDRTGVTLFEDNYSSRKGHWYLVLTVYDDDIKNCLLDKHPDKSVIIEYLKNLKEEYLATNNYEELLFAKKS